MATDMPLTRRGACVYHTSPSDSISTNKMVVVTPMSTYTTHCLEPLSLLTGASLSAFVAGVKREKDATEASVVNENNKVSKEQSTSRLPNNRLGSVCWRTWMSENPSKAVDSKDLHSIS